VHEDQEWEELEPEYEEALLEAMQEEPEMADYIHGHSQLGGEVPTFPPTWQISSQQWLISRDDPDPRLVTVAQPLDVQVWVQQHYPRAGYASHSSVDHTPDWSTGWKTATHTSPNQGYSYARDGNRHTMVSSDGTIHVWTDSSHPNRWGRARSKSPTSNWQQQPWRESQEWQGQPSQSQGWQDWDWQSCQQWHNQCQEWQDWGTGGASGSWGGWSAPAPPNPDRHLYRGVGADKRRKERRELQRQGKEVPPELQPLKISLNKALKRQMHELHTKAREMAQEEDTEKLKKWEEEQSIWLEIVAREEAEKKAASSTKSEDDSKEGDGPKPEEGSRNMPDDGTGDKAPDNMDIGNRARSRSLSSGIKSPRRFYSSRARPEMGRGVRLAHGLPIPEMEEEEAEDNKPEEGSRKKKKKRRSKSHKPEMAPVKEEPDPDGPPGPDGRGGAAAAAVT